MRSVGPRRPAVRVYFHYSQWAPHGEPLRKSPKPLHGFGDFGQLAGGFDGADEGWRDVFFFQGLADEAAEDDAFVAVEPGEVIDVQGLFIARIDVPQEAGRVIVEVDVQFAAGLFDHVRRGPGVFAAGRIDDAVQVAALAVVDHGLGQVHFKADFIGEVDAPFALVAALDVGVVEGDDGNLEVFQELLDLGNGTFAAGIDEADAVVIEGQVQGLGKVLETAVFRFPFDDEDAPRIEGFLDFREVHDQVFLDFFAEMEAGPAGRFDHALLVAVQADDMAVVVDEGIRRVGDDE